MAQKAFAQIKEAETQAKIIVKTAEEEAAQIINRAEEETAATFLQFVETCSRKGAENKQQIETDTQRSNNEFSKETDKLCSELKQKLLLNKSNAVDAVVAAIIDSAI